ncbi:MAG: hypothetical protein A2X48_16205 [Lentisphaerae bacterium GWF2_49_21]|nr:MAG: hypothetical protein A2X48_16205 [Lentisphaerae bacterium GWF2_49_21]
MNISNISAKERRIFILAALGLLCISSFLHFWKIGEVPNGFYPDESSVGYNAWCIAETGADEYGIKFPVFFKCFDNYQDPVYVYALAGFMKIFGPEKWVARLPGGIFHLLASIAFFFLATKYVRNRWICIAGAFVISILPWLFPLSRTGIGGYLPMVMGMTAGWYFIMDAVGRRSMASAVFAGFFWAFTMYSHQIGRPMGAVLLICFVISMNKLILKRMKIFALFSSIYLICMLPMIVYVCNHPESMTKRFSSLSVWRNAGGFYEIMARIIERYLEYFNPFFLFVSGDPILRHHTGESGELYIFMLPFIIAGIYIFYRRFARNPYVRFAVLALVAYPVAAVFTLNHFHSTRSMDGAVVWPIIFIAGMAYIFRRRSEKIFKVGFYSLLIFFIFEAGLYMSNYFGRYVEKSRLEFTAPIVEALEFSFKNMKSGETLYISESAIPQKINTEFKPFWYSSLLFFGKVPPSVYQEQGIPREYICLYQGQSLGKGILIRSNIVSFKDEGGIVRSVQNNEQIPENGTLIRQFPILKGEKAFLELYCIK